MKGLLGMEGEKFKLRTETVATCRELNSFKRARTTRCGAKGDRKKTHVKTTKRIRAKGHKPGHNLGDEKPKNWERRRKGRGMVFKRSLRGTNSEDKEKGDAKGCDPEIL